jgi:hypothetical protein
MSFAGVCQVCESAEARYTCDQCGAAVCETHYDARYGLCTRCAAQVRRSGVE